MPLVLLQATVIGDELALSWNDGSEAYLKLEPLRRACPCASCQGEADGINPVQKPVVQYRPESFVLQSSVLVGNYGFQPTWGDGHRTGIYAFDYLKKLYFAGDPESKKGCCGGHSHPSH